MDTSSDISSGDEDSENGSEAEQENACEDTVMEANEDEENEDDDKDNYLEEDGEEEMDDNEVEDPFYILAAGDHVVCLPGTIVEESAMIRRLSEFFDSMEKMAHEPMGPCGTVDNPFPLPSLGKEMLKTIRCWLRDHASSYIAWRAFTDRDLREDPENRKEWKGVKSWTAMFFNSYMFFELFTTAEFLEMRSLVVACIKYCTFCFASLTADEIRRVYDIPRDLSVAEEEALTERILRLQVMLPIKDDYNIHGGKGDVRPAQKSTATAPRHTGNNQQGAAAAPVHADGAGPADAPQAN